MASRLISWAIISALLFVVAGLDRPASAEDADSHCSGSFNFENDVLADTDRNYTFGLVLMHSCTSKNSDSDRPQLSFLRDWNDEWLDFISPAFGISGLKPKIYSHFGGILLYTPNTLENVDPGPEDGRPYASLLLYGDSVLRANNTVAIKQELQLGVMGFFVGGAIQDAVHHAIGSVDPQGWSTEISRGGEPVFGYAIQKKKLLCAVDTANGVCGKGHYDVAANWGASVGSYTSARVGLAGRLGLGGTLRSPFWGDYGSVINQHSGVIGSKNAGATGSTQGGSEWYLFATAGMDAIAYSAVLQGQFRSNDYEVASSDVKRAVLHASIGTVMNFGCCRLSVTYSLRGPEIAGGKSHRWTSISTGWMF